MSICRINIKKKQKIYKIHKNKNYGENRVIRIKNIIIA